MPSRSGPVHVATTTRTYKGKTYCSHLLRRSFRQGAKVRHETLGNLSHLPAEIIAMIRASLRGEKFIAASEGLRIRRSLPHGHVAAVVGTLRRLGLERMLASRASPALTAVVAMIAARILHPGSKLATARGWHEPTASSSLGEVLGVQFSREDELYAAMDWLLERQPVLEARLAARHLHDGSLILYDVSSSYYTGTHCDLAEFGHNRDGDNGYPQIVYGLLCNAAGCPVAVEVFSGNTADPKTLVSQIQKLRERFRIERVVLVGDRGMLTQARIDQELRGVPGLDWITALRAPAIARLAEQKLVEPGLFDTRDLAQISSPDYPGERLIVCRNPFLAQERARKREELLQATEQQLEQIRRATQRERRPLRGKDQIGLRVGKLINHYKMAKHFIVQIEHDSFCFRRDRDNIAEESALDGIYVIRTSVAEHLLPAEPSVRAYKDLAKVERAFRSLKTVDIKVRPIYHRLDSRVRAHVLLCMLAYYVEWHMRQLLQPMLFDDDDPPAAQARRASVVQPAQVSPRAQAKAATKLTPEGWPVHSFHTLLEDLGTLARNRVQLDGADAAQFELLTEPTNLQRRAFELLGVSPNL
jgi:hypothetical protein